MSSVAATKTNSIIVDLARLYAQQLQKNQVPQIDSMSIHWNEQQSSILFYYLDGGDRDQQAIHIRPNQMGCIAQPPSIYNYCGRNLASEFKRCLCEAKLASLGDPIQTAARSTLLEYKKYINNNSDFVCIVSFKFVANRFTIEQSMRNHKQPTSWSSQNTVFESDSFMKEMMYLFERDGLFSPRNEPCQQRNAGIKRRNEEAYTPNDDITTKSLKTEPDS